MITSVRHSRACVCKKVPPDCICHQDVTRTQSACVHMRHAHGQRGGGFLADNLVEIAFREQIHIYMFHRKRLKHITSPSCMFTSHEVLLNAQTNNRSPCSIDMEMLTFSTKVLTVLLREGQKPKRQNLKLF